MFKAIAPRHFFGAIFTFVAVGALGSVGCTVTATDTCDKATDPNCTCDPNTDPNHCQTTCDPNTDPNHCQTCDPATDPSCQTTCDPATGTGCTGGHVDVPAAALISNGGGSGTDILNIDYTLTTKADILSGGGGSIANYVEVSTPAGTTATLKAGSDVAHFYGLSAGTITFNVQGYLRGLNGHNADAPSAKIAWTAPTTCTATYDGTTNVTATCTPLQVDTNLSGIVFASDVLPDGYCAGTGTTNFSDFRAREPFQGTADTSVAENDCLGVIFVPSTEFAGGEDSTFTSQWGLSLETTGSGPACSLSAPCSVTRAAADQIKIVGSECQVTAASTGDSSCF